MGTESLLLTVVQATGGLVLLYTGGEALVRASVALALQIGISRVAVGLTVVALGTSAPELVVSVDAALAGAAGIAVGNVVGSNIANVALILGLSALVFPAVIPAKIARFDLPLVVLASAWLVGTLLDGVVSRVEGALLLLGLVIYVVYTFWEARAFPEETEHPPAPPGTARPAWWNIALIVLGLAALVGGGHLLVRSSVALATVLGVSEAAIGLTIVAVGTSLPELAASLVAASRRHSEIAVGNIVGSSMFNILGIVGATATLHPLAPGGITRWDLGLMAALPVGLLVLARAGRTLARVEGGVLVTVWVVYTAWLLAG